MAKIENINELKTAQEAKQTELQEREIETAGTFYNRIASRENREATVVAIGEFAIKSNLKLEEMILGMADYCSGMLVASIAENLPNEEELSKAEERFNDTRIALAEVLNGIRDTSMADNVLAMLALVGESITALAAEAVKME